MVEARLYTRLRSSFMLLSGLFPCRELLVCVFVTICCSVSDGGGCCNVDSFLLDEVIFEVLAFFAFFVGGSGMSAEHVERFVSSV
jgi:hypothetical protein